MRRQTSTSSVGWLGPPSTRMTPNDVKQNRNTMVADATIAGRSSGRVRWRMACNGVAPSVAAASWSCGSMPAANAPTVRTTTARLIQTWAMMIAATVRCIPSGSSARNAAPTATVGSTNGTVTSASTVAPPGEAEAGQHVGGDEADRHGEGRAHRRLPEREPDDRALPPVAEHVGDRCQVESPGDDGQDGPDVEDDEEQRRRDRQPAARAPRRSGASTPRQPRTVRVHVSTHSSRWAAMSAGDTVSGFSTCSANCSKTSGSSTSRRAG